MHVPVSEPLHTTQIVSCAGDLQSTLLAMRGSAYEASVALSAYGNVVRGHSALTSECGSMLEEVCAKGLILVEVYFAL